VLVGVLRKQIHLRTSSDKGVAKWQQIYQRNI
jgi:hypothetical protein